jgi:hypothetical protein
MRVLRQFPQQDTEPPPRQTTPTPEQVAEVVCGIVVGEVSLNGLAVLV